MPDYRTLEARKARSRKVCRLLGGRIGEVVSPGLGRWEPGWQVIRVPSLELLKALEEWERTGAEAAMDRAKAKALEVLEAWKEADRLFRDAHTVGRHAAHPEAR
ncbi:MAG: hypothetical protein EA421_05400 [Gemmatimonadales bacterium]|nr:MAG: hypothetical protein EA421_05400 [Gemmatimonadales bacterium]